MKMGEGGAFIAGGLVGGAIAGPAGYQAGYDQRDSELQPVIRKLQDQLYAKDLQLTAKDLQIAQLRRQLDAKNSIPVISQIRKKLGGSQS